jgi:hypothetical protein
MIAAMGYWHLSRGKNSPLDLDVYSKKARVLNDLSSNG